MSEDTKTFVWYDVLSGYSPGMAVMCGESKEELFNKIREMKAEGRIKNYLADELLTSDPEELDEGEVRYVHGGG